MLWKTGKDLNTRSDNKKREGREPLLVKGGIMKREGKMFQKTPLSICDTFLEKHRNTML